MTENVVRPCILVDLAKNRIRIHRVTLTALENPNYILIIVNPIEKTLGIMEGKRDEAGVHKVKLVGRNCYELYSRSLTQKFRQICPNWEETGRYRMFGTVIPDKKVACFEMTEAEFTGIGTVS